MRFDDSPVDDDQVPPALTLLATKSASSGGRRRSSRCRRATARPGVCDVVVMGGEAVGAWLPSAHRLGAQLVGQPGRTAPRSRRRSRRVLVKRRSL